MENKRTLIDMGLILLCLISIACGLRDYIKIVDMTEGRTQTTGIITAVGSDGAVVRFEVGSEQYNTSIKEYNRDTEVGNKVKIAYNNSMYNDIVYIGDISFRSNFLLILGGLMLVSIVIKLVVYVTQAKKIELVTGRISEVVQVIDGEAKNSYYAMANGVHPITKQVIQAKSNEFNERVKENTSVGSHVIIQVDKSTGKGIFYIGEEK